ncbi:MAG: hypothetical protein IKJ36_04450 [Clostridia bacterium]|nr:hypothetical protein [Clostridia bacterium]
MRDEILENKIIENLNLRMAVDKMINEYEEECLKRVKILKTVAMFICCLILSLGVSYAGMRVLEIDDKGRVIIKSSMDHLVVEKDTPIVVAIQDDENMEINDEINKKEKDNFINNTLRTTSDSITTDNLMDNSYLLEKEIEIQKILNKYYGNEYTNQLLKSIQSEIDNNNNNNELKEYEIPDSSIKLLDNLIKILDHKDLIELEKNVIIKFIDEIDTSFIQDEDIINELKRLDLLDK